MLCEELLPQKAPMLCVTFSPEKAPILGVKVLLKKGPHVTRVEHNFLAKKALHVMLINYHPKGPHVKR